MAEKMLSRCCGERKILMLLHYLNIPSSLRRLHFLEEKRKGEEETSPSKPYFNDFKLA